MDFGQRRSQVWADRTAGEDLVVSMIVSRVPAAKTPRLPNLEITPGSVAWCGSSNISKDGVH